MASAPFKLKLLPETFAVARLAPAAPLPGWAAAGSFISITRTAHELSIIAPAASVPDEARQERGFRCLGVQSPLDFSEVGVLAALAGPLAEARVSILAVATFDTDYLLVRQSDLARATAALRAAGHDIRET